MGNPFPVSLPAESAKATKILTEFTSPNRVDQVVPASILARAKGFAIFSVFRIGFLMSARGGSGVVVARLPDGTWSPPAAIGLGGLGGGFNAGAEVTDFLIVLTSRRAVSTFMSTGSLQLGGNMALAVGPLGRAAEAGGRVSSTGKLAAMLSYSKSKGLYGGISLEGTILMDRSDANAKYYGSGITSKHILAGRIETPTFAIGLTEKLNHVSRRPTAAEAMSFYDDDSSVVSPVSSQDTTSYYGGRGSGAGAGGGGGSSRPGGARRDPFDDSDSEEEDAYGGTWRGQSTRSPPPPRSTSFRDTGFVPERRPNYSRRTQSDVMPRGGGGHWVNAYSGEARAMNERHRFDDMDPFDRELQQDPSVPSNRGTRFGSFSGGGSGGGSGSGSRLGSRFGSSSNTVPNGKNAWASNYSFGGPPPRGGSGLGRRRQPSQDRFDGLDDLRDGAPGYRSPPVSEDYEANLSTSRPGGSSRFGGGNRSGSTVGDRPTSPIESDRYDSRSAATPALDSAPGASAPTSSSALADETMVMAKFAYEPTSSDTDIHFAAGDVIHVTQRTATRDDWWAGECHGKVGYFPANYTVDL